MSLQFTRGAGGKFTGSVGGVRMSPAMAALYARLGAAAGGPMSYNRGANRGTGYGLKHGDPRVRLLQRALNRLGLRDAHGRPLAVDGKLGPLTTSAIQAAQRRLGVKPDGVVTPKLMAQILAMPKPHASTHRARHKMAAGRNPTKTPVRASGTPTARSRMR